MYDKNIYYHDNNKSVSYTHLPGTRNRVVSISGSPDAISAAQYLIERKIGDEEIKRNRQNALGLLQ